MFELAKACLDEMLKPIARRSIVDSRGIARQLQDFKHFECTEIWDIAKSLAERKAVVDNDLAFLPAEKVWIEFAGGLKAIEGEPAALRTAFLLERTASNTAMVSVAARWPDLSGPVIGRPLGFMPLNEHGDLGALVKGVVGGPHPNHLGKWAAVIYGLLALINTPRIIGRKTHVPNGHIQRAIQQARGLSGRFPLGACTTLKLRVLETTVEDDREHTAWLTGDRAQHFVRAHLRIIGGVVVQVGGRRVVIGGRKVRVKEHYRGNPGLGMKHTRYSMRPPRNPPPSPPA